MYQLAIIQISHFFYFLVMMAAMFESGLSPQPWFLEGIISVSVTLILEAIANWSIKWFFRIFYWFYSNVLFIAKAAMLDDRGKVRHNFESIHPKDNCGQVCF